MPREFKTKFVISIVITLVILVIVIAAIFYLQGDINNKSNTIAQINQGVINKTDALKALTNLEQQEVIATPLLQKMNSVLPSQDMLFSLQQNLQTMARNDSLAFSSQFGAETSPSQATAGEIAIEMTLQGSYNAILTFLQSVESNTGFLSVSSIDITANQGIFNANVTGNIPFHE